MQADHLTAQAVADYLQDHPDFFMQRPELVDRLALNLPQQGAVSLVSVQMRRQRQKIEELEEDITQMMSLAAKNDRTFHHLMTLQQSLFTCENLESLQYELSEYSAKLGLSAHVLLLGSSSPKMHLSSLVYKRFLTNHLNGKEAYLGRLNQQDRTDLFGESLFAQNQLSELGSYVILPLNQQDNALGLLAFASAEGGHFQPDMDTLFLRHLASLVAFMVNNFDVEKSVEASA